MSAPRVLTIPPGAPFLTTFADALVRGKIVTGLTGDDPLALARATIFVPTRRAAAALSRALAAHLPGGAGLLPRIVPLGDVEAADLDGAPDETPDLPQGWDADAALPPAIGETERLLVLAQLVLAFAQKLDRAALHHDPGEPLLVPASPADAVALAGDLARLMDALTADGVDWERLKGLAEERFDRYFAIILDFLQIAAEAWPAHLAERGLSDPALRRHAIIENAAERLLAEKPDAPMIVAGSTGSMPATARLIAAIGRLPNGAVVLPGLDLALDEPSWASLASDPDGDGAVYGHPQALLARLLRTIGIERAGVDELGAEPPEGAARTRLLSEALRPAATTDLWAKPEHQPDGKKRAQALDGLSLIEAADERAEALAAALAIREALEDERARVALITPDRGLAQRVAAELKRWGVEAADSAGTPLSRTLPGRLARLAAEAVCGGFQPRALVALLSHPLVRLGREAGEGARAAAALEIGLLRGPLPPRGLEGLMAILPERRAEANDKYAPRPLRRLTEADWALVADTLQRLKAAFGPFTAASETGGLVSFAAAHRAALEALTARPDGEDHLASGRAGEALAALFDDLAGCTHCALPGGLTDYPAFFTALAGARAVPPETPAHPRVAILGLLEARLLDFDRVVLGGLDESIWPPAARTDAFLNRPMRLAIGLTPPERRIGQTAHDLVQALGAREAVITRARKRGGAPTVPSRFIQRLQALAGPAWDEVRWRGTFYTAWAAALDRADGPGPVSRPQPRPPRDLIPARLSVTKIETLIRDPYAIFAKFILGLDALDELGVEPGAADRGNIIHAALGRFSEVYPTDLPPDALDQLLAFGREAFAPLQAYPDIAAQYWPRFERLAHAFLHWEEARRPACTRIYAEAGGTLVLDNIDGEPFTLTARADRIEARRDGGFAIIDFKTGAPPSAEQVIAGFAPQLTLEAAMLRAGGFPGLLAAPGSVKLAYIITNGGADELVERAIKPKDKSTLDDVIAEHVEGVRTIIARYRAGAPFVSRAFPQFILKKGGPYDHLARVAEWSLGTDGEDASDAGGEA